MPKKSDDPREWVYLDSCLLIDYLTDENKENAVAVGKIIERAKAGEVMIVVSAAVISEVRPRPEYISDRLGVVDDLLLSARKFVYRAPMLPIAVGKLAREIGTKHPVLPMDALHVATALRERVDAFYTNDGNSPSKPKRRSPKKLLALNGKIDDFDGGPPLKIETPPLYKNTLFEEMENAEKAKASAAALIGATVSGGSPPGTPASGPGEAGGEAKAPAPTKDGEFQVDPGWRARALAAAAEAEKAKLSEPVVSETDDPP